MNRRLVRRSTAAVTVSLTVLFAGTAARAEETRLAPHPPPAPSRARTSDELAVYYGTAAAYGVGTGAAVAVFTHGESATPAVLAGIGTAGLGVAAMAIPDASAKARFGLPHAIAAGTWVGASAGALGSVLAAHSPNDASVPVAVALGVTTAGVIGGAVVGATAEGVTPGRASWVMSTSVWSGFVGTAVAAAASPDGTSANVPAGVGIAGVGMGLGVGLVTAASVSPSVARVRLLDVGAITGGAAAGALYGAISGDLHGFDGHAFAGVMAGGAAFGLGTAWLLTRSMPNEGADDERGPVVMPTITPVERGAILGVSGRL